MNRHHVVLILICLSLIFAQEGNTRLPHEWPAMPVGIHTAVNEYAVPAIDSLIKSLINQTNLDTLVHTVNILSGEDSVTINDSTYLLLSRNALHPHNDLAADFIFQSLNRFGLPTYNQIYSSTGRNVYSIKTGTDYPDKNLLSAPIMMIRLFDRPHQEQMIMPVEPRRFWRRRGFYPKYRLPIPSYLRSGMKRRSVILGASILHSRHFNPERIFWGSLT